MNRKLIIIGIVFIVIIGIASAVILFLAGGEKKAADDRNRSLAVSVNEIRQNIIAGDDEAALEACDSLTAENEKQKNNSLWLLITPLMISVVAVIIMLIYLDRQVFGARGCAEQQDGNRYTVTRYQDAYRVRARLC